MTRIKRVLAIVQPLVVVLGFVVLVFLLRQQWQSLRSYRWSLDLSWMAVSATLLITGWLIEIVQWRRILDLLGGSLDYWSAVRIWFTSTIARYVPGNVWQPLSLTVLCQKENIRPEAALASLSLFHVVHLMAISAITVGYLAIWGDSSERLRALSDWRAALIAVPLVWFLARPSGMLTIVNTLLVKFGREPLPVRLSTGPLVRLLSISIVAWLCLSMGFVAFAAALTPADVWPSGAIPHIAAAYPIAYAIGFLSLLTPSGLVVREGVLYLLLAPIVGTEPAILIPIAMRVWEIALEMLISAVAIASAWRSPVA